MAGREYRRLRCRTCGDAFTQSGRGRNAYTCPKCRGDRKAKRPQVTKAPKRTYSEYVDQLRANSKYGFYCEQCGKYEVRKPGGTARKTGYSNRWCSMDCRKRMAERTRADVKWLRGMAASYRRLERERGRRLEALERESGVRCKRCGVLAARHKKWSRFCSAECKAEADRGAARASRKRDKATRRARKRIASDLIDPIKVFERDGWRCHICQKKLRPQDRGTNKPTAPELEHIVSLADGGTHTWGNVACACRSCNLRKGAASFGQLGFEIAA